MTKERVLKKVYLEGGKFFKEDGEEVSPTIVSVQTLRWRRDSWEDNEILLQRTIKKSAPAAANAYVLGREEGAFEGLRGGPTYFIGIMYLKV